MTAKKKIAFLCHPYHRGGVTRWMADAALAYAAQGWETYFVTVAPSVVFFSGKGRETLLQLLGKGIYTLKVITAKAGREFEFGTREYRAYVYAMLLQQLPVGTPIILSDDGAIWDAGVMVRHSYPIIGVLHADEVYYYELAGKYYSELSAMVCVSERVKRNTIKRIPGIDKDTLYTIPCGINLPKANFQGHGNVLQLVYVGRVSDYQKRTSDLVKLCERLHETGAVFHLNIIGDGADRGALENKFKEEGLSSFVTFYGWLAQQAVGAWLSKSDILVLTSDFEGTPIAMMEGLAAGCGLVGTRVSGIEDYEYNALAKNCIALFDVGDIDDAVAKIERLAAVTVKIRQEAARKIAETEFSMEVCLKRYNAAIDKIKSGESMPAATIKMPLQIMLYSRMMAWARFIKVATAHKQ